ncbi:MAG: hypothetical protein GEU26_03075 [Nitrososphaeraceae archaeon]|nr:hypothetical protein [Nitrososphaeraceae archaeon]
MNPLNNIAHRKEEKVLIDNSTKQKKKGPILTSTSHLMSYLTVKNIQADLQIQETKWPKYSEKELTDNSYDWLNDHYPAPTADEKVRKIAVRIKIDSILDSMQNERIILRLVVRNSNIDNIPVFEELGYIFDYAKWASTKRHQYRMTCGSQGDFLKRSLCMGYASWTAMDNTEYSFEDNQWPEPVILRFNGQEYKVFVRIDMSIPKITPVIKGPTKCDATAFTEVETALPIESTANQNWKNNVNRVLNELEDYYENYMIAKTGTEFSFIRTDSL